MMIAFYHLDLIDRKQKGKQGKVKHMPFEFVSEIDIILSLSM